MKIKSLLLAVTLLATPEHGAPAVLPAFPGAEGFGAPASGGRAGEIVHVTSLDDAGPGSFRDAVSKPGRLVVFDVGGVVRLKANVAVRSDITLLGQTAPGEGIAFYGRSVSFSGSSNVIVRYLRFRQGIGGDRGKCAINVAGGSHMIFDHLSIEWGRWDCLGITQGSHDITVQNCLIGQGIDPQRFGALVDSVTNVTLSHNLWIDNQSRNPKAKGTVQYINNVVYNWGVTGLVGGHSAADHYLDATGNYFIKGPSSTGGCLGMFAATDKVFQKDNWADLDGDGKAGGQLVVEEEFGRGQSAPVFRPQPVLDPPVPVTVQPAREALQSVIAGAGCSLRRDAADERLVAEVRSFGKTGRIVRNETEAGGMSELRGGELPVSTVRDGIPDSWKVAHKLDTRDPAVAKGDYNSDGYINLEKYANELVRVPAR